MPLITEKLTRDVLRTAVTEPDSRVARPMRLHGNRRKSFARKAERVFGRGRRVRELEFHVYAASKYERRPQPPRKRRAKAKRRGPAATPPRTTAKPPVEPTVLHMRSNDSGERQRVMRSLSGTRVKYEWSNHAPAVYVNAMVLAGDCLFAAGPEAIRNEATAEALARWRGKEGGILNCYSRQDGPLIRTHNLPPPTVFDGMAAAYGKLYLSLSDGSVSCLSKDR